MGSRRLAPVSKSCFAKIIDNEEEATARLSLSPKSRVLKLERLRQAAGEPFAWDLLLVALIFWIALGSTADRVSFSTLEREYGIELGYSDEEVD